MRRSAASSTFCANSDLLDRTIVVVIADHGEGLGDHGEATHGIFVYESVIRVPFIVRTPFAGLTGSYRGRSDAKRRRDADAAGTRSTCPVADAIDGRSLVPLMTGQRRQPSISRPIPRACTRCTGSAGAICARSGPGVSRSSPRRVRSSTTWSGTRSKNTTCSTRERALGERMIDGFARWKYPPARAGCLAPAPKSMQTRPPSWPRWDTSADPACRLRPIAASCQTLKIRLAR